MASRLLQGTAAARHAVLGGTPLGSLMAVLLARAGAPVTLVVKPGSTGGGSRLICLEQDGGTIRHNVHVATQAPATEVVWLATTATELDTVLSGTPIRDSVRVIVPLQDGVDHLVPLRAHYGADRIVPATMVVEVEETSFNSIVQRTPFCRLSLPLISRPMLGGTITQLEKVGVTCRFVESETDLLWSGLVFSAPFALATTAANRTIGEVLADEHWRDLWEGSVWETCAVGRAAGADVDTEAALSLTLALPTSGRSSLQKDLERHCVSELEAISGPIVRHARLHGIEIPHTANLIAAVQRRLEPRGSESIPLLPRERR
jgi:2-dehydropantoate 2-reductase